MDYRKYQQRSAKRDRWSNCEGKESLPEGRGIDGSANKSASCEVENKFTYF